MGITLEGRTQVTLNHGTFRVGRQPDCDVIVDSFDVGRRHAVLYVDESGLSVEDLHSANGTFIDGAAVTGKSMVADGSCLRFATIEFSVHYERT